MLDALTRLLRTLLRVLLRLAVVLLGAALAVLLVIVGVLVASGLVLWSRLRGRPVTIGSFRFRMKPQTAGPAARSSGDVIDIDARVVPEAERIKRLPGD